MEIETIKQIASEQGWAEIDHQENIKMISFRSAQRRINVYYSKMTVATCVDHPKYGRTQMFRRGIWDEAELRTLFKNPRVHTGGGYFQTNGGHPPKINQPAATPRWNKTQPERVGIRLKWYDRFWIWFWIGRHNKKAS